jgi:drug/metabolite transporter (DMT)-like permease
MVAVPLLAVLWGLNWPSVRVLLAWWSPWQMRTVGLGVGALLLFALSRLRGQSLQVPAGMRWRLVVSALLSIVGLALLAVPLQSDGASLLGILFALGASLSWAGGTVFLKRFPLTVAPLPATAWQLAIGAAVTLAGWMVSVSSGGGSPTGAPAWPEHWFWIALGFHVLFAMALGYLVWFDVVARLPGGVAALGTLLVPVVGVTGAMLLLGERPTASDIAGLVLITAAAAIVLRPGR